MFDLFIFIFSFLIHLPPADHHPSSLTGAGRPSLPLQPTMFARYYSGYCCTWYLYILFYFPYLFSSRFIRPLVFSPAFPTLFCAGAEGGAGLGNSGEEKHDEAQTDCSIAGGKERQMALLLCGYGIGASNE